MKFFGVDVQMKKVVHIREIQPISIFSNETLSMNILKKQVPTERCYHREYSCEFIKALALTIQMLLIRLKYSKVGQTLKSRSQCQNCWFPWNGFVTINTHVKYQSSSLIVQKL